MSDFHEDTQIDYETIRRRVNQRILRWGLLVIHFIVWVVGAGILDITLGEVGQLLILGWFGLVGMHAGVLGLYELRERLFQREIMRERQSTSSPRYEKLKRDRLYRLSDSGELVEVADEKLKRLELSDDGEMIEIADEIPKRSADES